MKQFDEMMTILNDMNLNQTPMQDIATVHAAEQLTRIADALEPPLSTSK